MLRGVEEEPLVYIAGYWCPEKAFFSISIKKYALSTPMAQSRWMVFGKNGLQEVDISKNEYRRSKYEPYPNLVISDSSFAKGHIYCLEVRSLNGDVVKSNQVDLKKLPKFSVRIPQNLTLCKDVVLDTVLETNEQPDFVTWLTRKKKPKTARDIKTKKIVETERLRISSPKYKGTTLYPEDNIHVQLVINDFSLKDEAAYCILARTRHGFGKSQYVALEHKALVILSGPSVVKKGNTIHCRYCISKESTISSIEWQRKIKETWKCFSGSSRVQIDFASRSLKIRNAVEEDSACYRVIMKTGDNFFLQSNIIEIVIISNEKIGSETKTNYHRFEDLEELAGEAMRLYFDEVIPPMKLMDHIRENFKKLNSSIIKCPGRNRAIYSRNLDISQMYHILRNTADIGQPTSDWGNIPLENHTNYGDDIERIHQHRNYRAHLLPHSIETSTFNLKALDLIAAIFRLSWGSLLERTYTILDDSASSAKLQHRMKYPHTRRIDSDFEVSLQNDKNTERSGFFCLIICVAGSKVSTLIRKHKFACLGEGKKPDMNVIKAKCVEETKMSFQCFKISNMQEKALWHIADFIVFFFEKYEVEHFSISFPLKLSVVFRDSRSYLKFQEDLSRNIIKAHLEKTILCQSYTEVFGLKPDDLNVEFEASSLRDYSEKDCSGHISIEKRIAVNAKDLYSSDQLLLTKFCEEFNFISENIGLEDLDKTIFESSFSMQSPIITNILRKILENPLWKGEDCEDKARFLIFEIIEFRKKYLFSKMKCFKGSIYLIFTFTSVAQSKIFWEAERKGSIDEDFLRLLRCPKYFENIGPHGIQSCIVIEKSKYITLPDEEESAGSFNKKVLAEEIWENIKSRNLGYVFNGKTCSLETVLKAFTEFLDDNVHDDELLETFFVEFNRDDFVGTTNITPKGDKFWIFKETAVLPSLMLKRKSYKELVIYYAKVVWWIVYFGHFQLLSYLVRRMRAAGMSDGDLFGENDFEKSRLLILGCYSGSCDVVQLLLEHVPRKCIDTLIPSINDTSTDTEKSEDLFDKAVVSEREDGIFYFSNFEHSNSGYYSPLSAAVQTSKHITELLVSKGATINSRFGNKSPLYIAALNGRLDVVDFLLNQGASSSIGSKCRYYHFSFQQNDSRVEECDLPPISAAAMNNHSRIVVLLFDKSKEIDFTNMPYLSPLCMSITHCQCEVLENLLYLGVDENMPRILSAVCMAARLNNLRMLKLLKRHEFDINGGNGFLSTPLYEAAYYGHFEMFNYLLQEGADLKLWCRHTERKPLHAACSNGHLDIVKRIVKEVDRPKTMILSMDSKRKTAIDLARENNNKDIVSFLSEYLQGLVVRSKSAPV